MLQKEQKPKIFCIFVGESDLAATRILLHENKIDHLIEAPEYGTIDEVAFLMKEDGIKYELWKATKMGPVAVPKSK